MWCLTPKLAEEFKNKIASGEITPEKLKEMTSEERAKYFTKIVGEENAKQLNLSYEKKLLLKNEKQAVINWVRETVGLSVKEKEAYLERVRAEYSRKEQRLYNPKETETFLAELAKDKFSKKYKTDVSYEETKQIVDSLNIIEELKGKIGKDEPRNSINRNKYGAALYLYNEYIKSLKKPNFKEQFKNPVEGFYTLAGNLKSIVSSIDNSFFGRQGIKMLYTNPDIWIKNFTKSFGDIGKELKGQDAKLPIYSDILSRDNAINGLYKRMKLDLGISEEAFPESAFEKIPVLKRLFKASESAYNGGAARMRADLADRVAKYAEKHGIDLNDKYQAESFGKLINSTTGRGQVGRVEQLGKPVNATLFSIKFLKSNFDTLTAHMLDPKMSKEAKVMAATNLLKIIGSTAALMATANYLYPGSVETDPRSSNFGKIKIGDTRFDVTGGISSLATLFSRMTPTWHDGEFGWWTKSATTGKYTKLSTGEFGSLTPVDVFEQFLEGKLSPLLGVIRDIYKQEDFSGNKITVGGLVSNAVLPMSIQNFLELLRNENSAPLIPSLILDFIGINPSTYGPKPSTGKPKRTF